MQIKRYFLRPLSYLYQKKVFGFLILGFSFTAIMSWVYLNSAIQKNINYRLDHEMNSIVGAVNSNIFNHANTLGYVQAYFRTEGLPSKATFRRLAESIEIQQINHGIQGLGYISIVRKDELKKFVRENKNTPFFNTESLQPGRELYAPITMIEPMNSLRNSRLGFDMFLEDTRRDAVMNAIQSSTPTLSRPLKHIVVQDPAPEPALILLLPFYKTVETPATPEERLKQIRGIIYIPMRMRKFLEATLGEANLANERVNFRISYLDDHSGAETLLYQRFDIAPDGKSLSQSRILNVYGHKWKVTLTTFPHFFFFGDRYLANTVAFCFILFIGLLLSLYQQSQNLLAHEKKAKELMEGAIRQSHDQTEKLKLLNDVNGQANLDLELSEGAEEFLKASLPLSESSHAFLFFGLSLENPDKISFYKSQGFRPLDLDTQVLSLREISRLLNNGNMVLKSDQGAPEVFRRFIKTHDDFSDWILVALPSREFRRCGLLFLGRKNHRTYNDIDIELIESLVSQFGIRVDNTRLFKKVEDSNKVKTAFLSNMSHEIRTPLNAITGFSEILEQTQSPEEKHSLIEGIKKNTTQLTSIIDNILDISKIEFGRLFINRKSISLSLLIRNLQSDMEARSQTKGLSFKIESLGALPAVILIDESRVKQILINLLGNAIKFTEKGSVTLQLQCDTSHAEDPVMVFNIIDTGIGISAQSQAQLFQSFTQLEDSNTRRFGGIGLGLALSRRLAQQFDGEVNLIQSDLEKGSIFQLRVPCGSLSGVQWLKNIFEDQENTEKSAHPQKVANLKDKKVLIVEDSLDNQEIFQFFLNSAGAKTQVIDNGEDAVKKAQSDPFDLILMDIQLPKMDGLEATRRIRAGGFTNPIIALTAHASSEEKLNCMKAGCIDLITKPVTQSTLIKRIQTIMEENNDV